MTLTNRSGVTAVVAATAVTMSIFGGAPASADTGPTDPLAAVSRATPDTVANAVPVAPRETGTTAMDARVAGADVTVPVDASAPISLDTGGGTLAVSLPFASKASDAAAERSGVVSYDNNNGSTSVPVITRDGSLQINTVIGAASAPARYSYELTIPAGGRVIPVGEGFFIVNADADPVAYVSEPWAKDANGAPVGTHYELNGTTLTQVVEFSPTTAFPVVADPQFAWYSLLPSVQLTRAETKTATTLTGMATVCGWVTRLTGYAGGALCGLNAASIIVNTQRIYYSEKRCAQLLIGPGVIATIGYSGGYCR